MRCLPRCQVGRLGERRLGAELLLITGPVPSPGGVHLTRLSLLTLEAAKFGHSAVGAVVIVSYLFPLSKSTPPVEKFELKTKHQPLVSFQIHGVV